MNSYKVHSIEPRMKMVELLKINEDEVAPPRSLIDDLFAQQYRDISNKKHDLIREKLSAYKLSEDDKEVLSECLFSEFYHNKDESFFLMYDGEPVLLITFKALTFNDPMKEPFVSTISFQYY